MTGAGAPGSWGLLTALRSGADRPIVLIGADMRRDAVGFALCDFAHVVPKADDAQFWPAVRSIIASEKIDVILPLVTRELDTFAAHREEAAQLGCRVAVSSFEAIDLVNDKGRTMQALADAGMEAARARVVATVSDLHEAVLAFGYPDVPVVIKPCRSNGSRGMRVLNPKANRRKMLLEEKPSSLVTTLDDVLAALSGSETLPAYVVMEHLPGDEYSVDSLADGERALVTIPRRRDNVRSGITFEGTVVKDEEIIRYCERAVELFRLWGPIGLQLKRDGTGCAKLIEINPRLQGTTALSVAAGVNIPWLSVRLALGERVEVGPVEWGRRVIRYWGDTFWDAEGRLIGPTRHVPDVRGRS